MVQSMDSVSHQLGVLSGRFDSIEKSIQDISEAIKTIASHSARVDLLEKAQEQHDKRIAALERENTALKLAQGLTDEKVEKHIEKDVPVEMRIGKWSLGAIGVLGGLIVKWLFDKLTR